MITISKTKLVLVSLASFLIGLFSTLLGYVLPENATEALKSVVTADAALVGFMGVITIFILHRFKMNLGG